MAFVTEGTHGMPSSRLTIIAWLCAAPITDPSWTPLFLAASAVVVNVGAVGTHAVIVSRELGIPCVPAVADATRRIPTGARVTVNGHEGTVTIDALPA